MVFKFLQRKVSAPLPAIEQIKGIDEKYAVILAKVEQSGIKINYERLLKQLKNPAVNSKDFQSIYPWQLVFFTVTERADLAAFVAKEKNIFPNKTHYRLNNYLNAAALGGNIVGMQCALSLFPAEKQAEAMQEALFYAARSGSIDAMKFALNNGAKAISNNEPLKEKVTGATLVHCAAESGSLDALQFAHAQVPIPNVDHTGQNVLHYAVQANNQLTAKYCLTHLAISPNKPDNNHTTARDLAQVHPNLIKLFDAKPQRTLIKSLDEKNTQAMEPSSAIAVAAPA